MKKSLWNNRITGIFFGLLGPLVILFGLNVYSFPELSFIGFIKNCLALNTLAFWLKPALLINLAIFFLAMNSNKLRTGQGVVFATIAYGFLIIYLSYIR